MQKLHEQTPALNGVDILNVSYGDNGNLLTKTGVSGAYNYGNAGAACNTNFAGPHAVTSVGTSSYCYDARGNQTHSTTSGIFSREIQYGYIDKPIRIISNSETTDFVYDSANNRIKRIDTKDSKTDTTYYVDGIEYIVESNGNTKYKRYIDSYAIQDIEGVNETINYVHVDHIGSMDTFTNSAGIVTERLSFDAFGDRRNAFGWQGSLTDLALLSIQDVTKRGFTGHEHIDHADIVHMNGRIYDSKIGRFVQADPIIQEVRDSQNYNRYSYVLNNPLSYTDPTGYACNVGFSAKTSSGCVNEGVKRSKNEAEPSTAEPTGEFAGQSGEIKKLASATDDKVDEGTNGDTPDGGCDTSLPSSRRKIIHDKYNDYLPADNDNRPETAIDFSAEDDAISTLRSPVTTTEPERFIFGSEDSRGILEYIFPGVTKGIKILSETLRSIATQMFADAWDLHFGIRAIGSAPLNPLKMPSPKRAAGSIYGGLRKVLFREQLSRNPAKTPREVLNRMGVGMAARAGIRDKWEDAVNLQGAGL